MKIPNAPIFRNRSAFPLAATLTGALLLAGCLTPADRETQDTGSGSAPALSREEGFKVLESLGYARNGIEAAGTDYIVEGDMVFTGESLARLRGAPLAKTAQRAETAVRFPKPNLLKVALHGTMTDWAKYVHQAVNNWNAPNTRLHLEVVPYSSAPDITIYSDASPDCPASMRNQPNTTDGIGRVGSGGYPGAALCINKDSDGNQIITRRITVLTHELGHTIGFHHTGTNDGVLIPGTPQSDFWSIMSPPGNTFGALTIDDHRALEVLYPSDKPLGGTNLDGDAWDDVVYWRPSNGMWSYLRSSAGYGSSLSSAFGQRGDWPMADMDLDADGIDDKVFWRTDIAVSDGWWHALHSKFGEIRKFQLGETGDIPIGNHNMDGDNKDDLVTWRWSNTTFYVLTSTSGYTTRLSYKWGDIGDIPVGGIDADRDGKDDFVCWRPSQRVFWVRFSGSNYTTSSPYFMAGAQAGDIPVGGMDLDRDSKDDIVLWSPGSGNWTALTSSSNFASTTTQQWGQRGDVPIIGTDLDLDGRKDIVVWRPSDGTWYVKKSNTSFNTWIGYFWGQ